MLIVSPAAALRLDYARDWLQSRALAEEVIIVAANRESGADLVRLVATSRGALFGWRWLTFSRFAAELAQAELTARKLGLASRIATQAVAARAVHHLSSRGEIGSFDDVVRAPGFPQTLADALLELRLCGTTPADLVEAAPEVGRLLEAYERELEFVRLADRAAVFRVAAEAVRNTPRTTLLGKPLLFLDVPVTTVAEAGLVAAAAAAAPGVLASAPAGDERSIGHLKQALGVEPHEIAEAEPRESSPRGALVRMRRYLFREAVPYTSVPDESVSVVSAPGENRECVEIARLLLEQAARGTPFDRMAVLLRSPEQYRQHLEEAFDRASVPAYFARGVRSPDPSGRAFLALLRTATEGLSARRFAEYLSLGQVPDADEEGRPPAALPPEQRWSAPDDELFPEPADDEARLVGDGGADLAAERIHEQEAPESRPVIGGTLRAPRHWERLLVEAAVIGSLDRWRRRLSGLGERYRLELNAAEDPEGPAAERTRRDLAALEGFQSYALPLMEELAALPGAASWGEWLERLTALASRSLRYPERVLSILAELVPLGPFGPVDLEEVCRVLSPHLLQVAVRPSNDRYGRVFVGPMESARGALFDVVFVPGVAERLFPRRIVEEPVLLDDVRARINAGLETNTERLAGERFLLRIAAGAARERLVLSYPRVDVEQARPRVPSFYALEALRAAEGQMPLLDELAARAEAVTTTRIAWPAPPSAERAIDDAEYDLAVLGTLGSVEHDHDELLSSHLPAFSASLRRAIRFRLDRWSRQWTRADGLVLLGGSTSPDADSASGSVSAGRTALERETLDQRAYSVTGLQDFAICPYRFFLGSIERLAPRPEAESLHEMGPLERGSLIHAVQHALLTRLRDTGQLPVTAANLDSVRDCLDGVLQESADRFAEELHPAIPRVWDTGVRAIRADLREWLRRMAEDQSGYVPWRFELAFGLPPAAVGDSGFSSEAVELDAGIRLRGRIDLLERSGTGRLRVTDHKTGKAWAGKDMVIGGGETLQPVLYALAAEKLHPALHVASGRLYYCTAMGAFEERIVALDDAARRAAEVVARVVGDALRTGFLPSLPRSGACRNCDFRPICGEQEEQRTRRKPPHEWLSELRKEV